MNFFVFVTHVKLGSSHDLIPFGCVSEESQGHKTDEGAGTSAEEAHTAFEWYFGQGEKLLGRTAVYDAKKIISRDSMSWM